MASEWSLEIEIYTELQQPDQATSGPHSGSPTVPIEMIYIIFAGAIVATLTWLAWLEIRSQHMWVFSQHTYEDFPLLLRRVERLPFPSRRKQLPILAVITHTFSERFVNGLPESDYNEGLAEMDSTLTNAMKDHAVGAPVLVETYGGRRMYYYYVVDQFPAKDRFENIKLLYPAEDLSFDSRSDADWSFMHKYAKDYFPDLPF